MAEPAPEASAPYRRSRAPLTLARSVALLTRAAATLYLEIRYGATVLERTCSATFWSHRYQRSVMRARASRKVETIAT